MPKRQSKIHRPSVDFRSALESCDFVAADKAIARGARIGADDLVESIQWRGTSRLEYFLDRGATAERERSPFGNTPLHVAVILARVDCVRLLALRRPLDALAVDDSGDTPLMLAVSTGPLEATEALASISDLDARSRSGKSLLDLAIHGPSKRYLEALILAGVEKAAFASKAGPALAGLDAAKKRI